MTRINVGYRIDSIFKYIKRRGEHTSRITRDKGKRKQAMNMLLTICSFMLFGALLLSDNNMISNNVHLSTDNQFSVTAIGLAQSVIEEAKSKAFDARQVGFDEDSLSQVLGPETGEWIALPDTLGSNGYQSTRVYSDVDDYNGYRRIVRISPSEYYTIDVGVVYTSTTAPDVEVSKSFSKKMTVTVNGPYQTASYSLTYVFTF